MQVRSVTWERGSCGSRAGAAERQKEEHMARRLSIASGAMVVLAAVFALLLAATVPALAHHKDGHNQGGGSETSESDTGESGSSASEDNDDNAHPSGKDRETN